MSTDSPWTIDPGCLERALRAWRATGPDDFTRNQVYDWLIDLARDPLLRGREEPDQPGVWYDRVPRTNLGVVYLPTERR
ncbi:MAG: hypothetical protein ACJ77A_13060 [Actinomycetota bacterium]